MSKTLSKEWPDFSLQRDAIKAAIEVSKKRAISFNEALDSLADARAILRELEGLVGYSKDDRQKIRRIDEVLEKNNRSNN